MSQLALFDDRPPTSDLTHVLMPCMGYACGETILTVAGHFVMGVHFEHDWDAITCEDCRTIGRDEIQTEMRRQQGQQA